MEVEEEAHSPFAKETPQDASALKVKRPGVCTLAEVLFLRFVGL
jgi:hypothetical protein